MLGTRWIKFVLIPWLAGTSCNSFYSNPLVFILYSTSSLFKNCFILSQLNKKSRFLKKGIIVKGFKKSNWSIYNEFFRMYEHSTSISRSLFYSFWLQDNLDPSSSPLSSPPSIRSSHTVGNSEEDEREMYKAYNWTCSRCHSTQEVIYRCTVAEHYLECDGQSSPVLQCRKCKTQTQTHVPSIDPALLAMSDGSVNSPQLTSSGSGTSSPLAERNGRFLRQRLATPCRRQAVRHHPYQHSASIPAGHRKNQRKSKPSTGEHLSHSAAAAAAAALPPPPPPPAKPSFTTEIGSGSSASPPPLPPRSHANGNGKGNTHARVNTHAHSRPSQPDVVNQMHVNRTRIFKTAAKDLIEAKAKLGDQAPQRACNAWEVAWDQLKKDMGIIFWIFVHHPKVSLCLFFFLCCYLN